MDIRELRQKIQQQVTQTGYRLPRRFFRWLDQAFADYTNVQSFGLLLAAILTGLLSVGYATAFRFVESNYDKLLELTPSAAFAIAPLLFVLAWWLVHRFAPEAAGSGIPQVMAAIDLEYEGKNKRFIDTLLSLRTGVVKVLSSLVCLAGGGAIGREGPTLQISAIVFHFFGQLVRRLYPESKEQTWVIAGAAAGLASAFNTPLGGIVYAIEELGMKHFHTVRTALLTSVIISGLVAQSLLGSYLYLGYPQLHPIPLSGWPLVIATGFVAGLCGAFFSEFLLFVLRLKRGLKSSWQLALFAIGCGLFAACLIADNKAAHGPGSAVINHALFSGEAATLRLSIERFLGTAVAYLTGAAGGIFSPSLAIGSCVGSYMASLFGNPEIGFFAILGMIGFLTGVTHTPFTSFILVMEMSNGSSGIFPMMVVALIANSTAKSIRSHSFYETVRDQWISKNTD